MCSAAAALQIPPSKSPPLFGKEKTAPRSSVLSMTPKHTELSKYYSHYFSGFGTATRRIAQLGCHKFFARKSKKFSNETGGNCIDILDQKKV
jgi:hypothetical protein